MILFLKTISPQFFWCHFPWWCSFLWLPCFFPHCVKVRPGLLGETALPLSPHTVPGYRYPCHHFSMDDDSTGGRMALKSSLGLRPLPCKHSTSQVSLKCLKEISTAPQPRQDSQQPSPTLPPHANMMYPVLKVPPPTPAQHHKHLVSHLGVLQVPPLNNSWICLVLSIPCLGSGPHHSLSGLLPLSDTVLPNSGCSPYTQASIPKNLSKMHLFAVLPYHCQD